MLLFPDVSREQHEAQEFVFASPCTFAEWQRVRDKAKRYPGYLPFALVKEDEETIAIICRKDCDSDDDCVTTAAWLRLVREFSGMIYALAYTHLPAPTSTGAIIARTAGVNPKQVRHVEV